MKVALSGGRVLIEVNGDDTRDLAQQTWDLPEKNGLIAKVSFQKVKAALDAQSGVVADVTE